MGIVPATLVLIDKAVARWRRYRAGARTRRIMSGLPTSILKDIGWPDALTNGACRRPSNHKRAP